jgi:hypothetical protein
VIHLCDFDRRDIKSNSNTLHGAYSAKSDRLLHRGFHTAWVDSGRWDYGLPVTAFDVPVIVAHCVSDRALPTIYKAESSPAALTLRFCRALSLCW